MATKKREVSEVSRKVTLIELVDNALGDFTPPIVKQDDPKALQILGEFLQSIDTMIKCGSIDIFDRGKARLSWLQGQVLSRAFAICKHRRENKTKEQMTWGNFLGNYWHYSEDTAAICRAIYERWPNGNGQEAIALGYWEAWRTIVRERKLARDGDKTGGKEKEEQGKGGQENDPPAPPTLSLGKHVKAIARDVAALHKEMDDMATETITSPEREGVIYKGFATSIDAALRDLVRAIDKLNKLALDTHGDSAKNDRATGNLDLVLLIDMILHHVPAAFLALLWHRHVDHFIRFFLGRRPTGLGAVLLAALAAGLLGVLFG